MPITKSKFIASFNLGDLNGFDGSQLNGIYPYSRTGYSVSTAGDINGDGLADILIGAPYASSNRDGQVYVIFGNRNSLSASLNLSSLNGTNGFILNGIYSESQTGYSVSTAGDVNGDGLADILIGAPQISMGNNVYVGQIYVVFGSRSWSANLNLSSLNGINGFTLNGTSFSFIQGSCPVSSAGDINGDGLADILIGLTGDNNGAQVYVVFGRSSWPATMNLSSLNGANGFIINGIDFGNSIGSSVSTAGDINGDGLSDILIGAPGTWSNEEFVQIIGQAYVIFGSRNPWPTNLALSSLNGANGFTLNGIYPNDQAGSAVSTAGDINGDGLADIVIGAPQTAWSAPGFPADISGAGQTHVILGSRNAWPASFGLSSLNGINGFTLNGINYGDGSGSAVSTAGDINGDGFADIVIGAPHASPSDNAKAGQVYVIFGSRNPWPASLNLSSLNGIFGFTLNGTQPNDQSGYSVSTAGDINDDGLADILIGAPYISDTQDPKTGQSYLVMTAPLQLTNNQLTITNDGYISFNLNNLLIEPILNNTVVSLLDVTHGQFELVNNPGIEINQFNQSQISKNSVMFSHDGSNIAPGYAVSCQNGLQQISDQQALVNFMPTLPIVSLYLPQYSLASLNGINGFTLNGINSGDGSGSAVSTAGDINGDGLMDILIGADFASPSGITQSAGQTYVIFGSRTAWPANMDLSSLNGTNGFILNGIHPNDYSGSSISTAGDFNGDGLDDILIATSPGQQAGSVYLIFGRRSPWPVSLDLSSLNGANGFTLNGITPLNSWNSLSVSTAGDVNGDGLADILIGESGVASNGNVASGQTFVIFGTQNAWPATVDLSFLNGANGFSLNGINEGDKSGSSVSTAGDINGDGLSDILIGAPYASSNGNNQAGQTYLIFGSRNAWPADMNLSSLDGMNGFVLNGINPGDNSGSLVSTAGDINGDGLADILIRASKWSNLGTLETSQTYVVFGSQNTWPASMSLSSLNGVNGFIINGTGAISSAGDINSDGLSDILIGAENANNAGQTSIVFGSRNLWPAIVSLSSLNGTRGFVLNGVNVGGYSGSSVSNAGDINGDGVTDLLIGATGANNGAGATYLIFGNNPYLQLASNQLTISNGQSMTVTSEILSIRSFAYSRELVQFSVSNLQHGHFQMSETFNGYACSAFCTAGNLTTFTQAQIDAGEIIFVHDGSQYAPSYSISYYPSKQFFNFSEPQPVMVDFVTYLSIQNISFTANQYQHKIDLSQLNIFAVDTFHQDQLDITFQINEVENGWFANINRPNAPLASFTQTQINQAQICFYSTCGINDISVLPSFVLTATAANGLTTAPATGIVSYNPAPIVVKNAITVNEQKSVVLTENNIAAVDNKTPSSNLTWFDPDIQFSITNITGGYFQNNQDGLPVLNFNQSQIMSGDITFVSNANTAPTYSLIATDSKGAGSLVQPGQVTFQKPGVNSSTGSNMMSIEIGAAVGGVTAIGTGFFLLSKFNQKQFKRYLYESTRLIDDITKQDVSLYKIAKVVFEEIKLKGFLGRINQQEVQGYVAAIKKILQELEALNFPVDLATMADKTKTHFLRTFTQEIKNAFPILQQKKITFFKSEITARQIESEAQHIAYNIKYKMDKIESQIIDDLTSTNGMQLRTVSTLPITRSAELREALIDDTNDYGQVRSKCYLM